MDPSPDDALLQLVFRGECLEGRDPLAVRQAVASALKLDERGAARLFSGKRVVLRREVEVAAAHRRIAQFAMMGAVLRAEPSRPRPATPTAASTAVRPTRPARPTLATKPAHAAASAGAATPGSAAASVEAANRPRLPRLASGFRWPGRMLPAELGTRPWPRPLRWAFNGMMFGAVTLLLGFVLGPGLNALLQTAEPPAAEVPRTAARPPVPADARPPVPVDTRPPVPADTRVPVAEAPRVAATAGSVSVPSTDDDEIPRDMTAEALREYRQRYLRAPDHRAFAISARGAYAWHGGAASGDDAVERALANCTLALRPGDVGCRVVHFDQDWLE